MLKGRALWRIVTDSERTPPGQPGAKVSHLRSEVSLKPRPDCIPCVLHQALQVARAASEDEWSQRKVLASVLQALPMADWDTSPAEILEDAFKAARDTLKVADPYFTLRQQTHEHFAALARAFRDRLAALEDSEERFALAVTAATAANLVDEQIFARFSKKDPEEAFEQALKSGFALGDPAQLREALEGAESVLYLLDNAGEAHFDRLLIKQLEAQGKRVRVGVRGGGLLHDATLEDALTAGLGPEGPVTIEETTEDEEPQPPSTQAELPADRPEPTPGAEGPSGQASAEEPPDLFELKPGRLAATRGKELTAALEASDVVIAKGSAYYETFTASSKEVFFLLRVKCNPVAASLGVHPGALVIHRVPPRAPAGEA